MENQAKLEKVIKKLTDMPAHKLAYVIQDKSLTLGLKLTIPRYGFPYTKEVHEVLVEMVGAKLSTNEDIEYEWSEAEYENFVKFSELPPSEIKS